MHTSGVGDSRTCTMFGANTALSARSSTCTGSRQCQPSARHPAQRPAQAAAAPAAAAAAAAVGPPARSPPPRRAVRVTAQAEGRAQQPPAGPHWRHSEEQRRQGEAGAGAAQRLSVLREALTPSAYPTRLLSPQDVFESLQSSAHAHARRHHAAFYSSDLGGITTHPGLMVLQVDDRMVHRGHAVFDAALIVDGHAYQLDRHLDRLLRSAYRAGIPLPRGLRVEQMKRSVLDTAAAGCRTQGTVKFWLSAGRGGFGLASGECLGSTFYCVAYDEPWDIHVSHAREKELLEGWRVRTSPVPPKPAFFARLKSTDYLPNALAAADAQRMGFNQAVFVDDAGSVAEGANANLAAILRDGTLVTPPFTHALDGLTMQRALELLPAAIARGMEVITRIEQRPLGVEEAKGAAEVFLTSTSGPVMPVVVWDDATIGEGSPGLGALQLRTMLINDRTPGPGSDQHDPVPYDYMTRGV